MKNSNNRRLWAAALIAAYFLAFGLAVAQRRPAGNLAYWVYSESGGLDAFCARFFLPAYRLQQGVWRLAGLPFARHNGDRPSADPVSVGL
jgi:hypothetical protein